MVNAAIQTLMKRVLSILLLILFVSCSNDKDDKREIYYELTKGDKMPSFTISNDKESVASDSLVGKTVIIIFFHSSCSDCQQAFPDINAIYNTYEASESVRVLIIARRESRSDVDAFLKANSYTVNYFADLDGSVYSMFALNTIPRLFLVGKDGKIVMTQTEYVDKEAVFKTVEQLNNP